MSKISQIETDVIGASAVTRFELVKTAGALVVTAANTDIPVGVVQDGYAATAADAAVCVFGETFAVAGAAVTQYAPISPTSSGEVIDHAGSQTRIGIALDAAAAQGDIFRIFLDVDKSHTAVG